MNKYIVKVNGKEHRVEFENKKDLNEVKEVILDGKKVNVDVNLDTLCSIVVDNNTHKINSIFEYDGEPVKFLIGQDHHDVEVEEILPVKKSTSKSSFKKGGKIVAPMPGKVISLLVNEGDTVRAGQDILILEAMKMENRIKSPVDGTVKLLKTAEGNSCNARELLMIIE